MCIKSTGYVIRNGHSRHCAAEVLYKILAILSVGGLCSGMRAWLFNGASERVMARLRARLFTQLMGQGTATLGTASRPGHRSVAPVAAYAAHTVQLDAVSETCHAPYSVSNSSMATEMGFFDRVRTGELMNRLSEVSQLALRVPLTLYRAPKC